MSDAIESAGERTPVVLFDEAKGCSAAPAHAPFPTTHWSIVLEARGEPGTTADEALESLCRTYWYPLYAFIRRLGHSHEEAEDCTQDFLARLLAGGGVARARSERGRFRSFLLTALRHYLINEWHRSRAAKRGGPAGVRIPCEFAEKKFALEPIDPGLTPEVAFDRNWALGLIDRALSEVGVEYENSGRGPLFAALVPLVRGNGGAGTRQELAASVGLDVTAFNVALHRLRQRLGQQLRACIAETVASPADIDAELRALITAVGGR